MLSFLQGSNTHVKLLEPFLDTPYRKDGLTNENEKYTIFTNSKKIYKQAGLVNTGFVFSACKKIFGKTLHIKHITNALNKNLDFKKQTVFYLASRYKYNLIAPRKGFNIHEIEKWHESFKK